MTSSVVPGAEGYAKVKKDNNKNYVIQIYITNLAEVSRLQTSKQTYVIWIVTDEGTTKNIGRLKTSSGLFSKSMKASFETVSSVKPTKIFITAEVDGIVQYPDSQIVLTTDKF
ncbi:MAG: hypothetical protein Q8928_05225 [Bacteroidota bacterium]|nr:hypothetical protein [Bacteroidota bacterium]